MISIQHQNMDGKMCKEFFVVMFLNLVLVIFSHGDNCRFPGFMQNGALVRDWRGLIKNQNTEFTLKIVVTAERIQTISTDDSATSHDRVCVEVVDGNKFLVAHEEAGQSSPMYTCVQFIQRGNSVVQIKEADKSTSFSNDLCRDSNLKLNPWLIIDQNNVDNEQQLCPLVGGFTVRMFDKLHGQGVCDSIDGQVRIESECAAGEGLFFHFRTMKCVPNYLFMYPNQQTLCLASWQETSMTFILLKHQDPGYKFKWLFRYPTSQGNNFIATLLMDLAADTETHIEVNNNYLRLDMVRDIAQPAYSLCIDDYEICTGWSDVCSSPEYAMYCPRTCGLCNASRPELCNFQSKEQAQWYNAANPGNLAISINSTNIVVFQESFSSKRVNYGVYHCVKWDREPANSDHTIRQQMLVRDFDNGCRPRYSCAEFVQNTPSLMFFKLSLEQTWPFSNSPEVPVDCRHFKYDHDKSITPTLFKSENLNLVYLRTTNMQRCNISNSIHNYSVIFDSKAECFVSVILNSAGNGFRLDMPNCPNVDIETRYTCVDSSKMLPRRDQLLVTRSQTNPDLIRCWFFPKRQEDTFYLLSAQECNEAIRKRLNKDKLQWLAVFENPSARIISTEGNSVNTAPITIDTPPRHHPGGTYRESPKLKVPDTTDGFQNDGSKLQPNGTDITTTGDKTKVTVISLLVVGTVLSFAVIQTFCICKS